jgi:nucleoside-diphosphate-sugar epimerase
MKIALFGAGGMIGRHIAEEVVSQGYDRGAPARRLSGRRWRRLIKKPQNAREFGATLNGIPMT